MGKERERKRESKKMEEKKRYRQKESEEIAKRPYRKKKTVRKAIRRNNLSPMHSFNLSYQHFLLLLKSKLY